MAPLKKKKKIRWTILLINTHIIRFDKALKAIGTYESDITLTGWK